MACATYIFAGGGTGGHLYPAVAVAQELGRIDAAAQIVFACSDRAIDRRVLEAPPGELGPVGKPWAIVPQPVRPLPRGPREAWAFLRGWSASRRLAGALIADLKPVAVLGLGGFAAGPLVRQAHQSGVRAAMLNPDAVPGKANRYLARHVQAIFAQFDSTRESFAPAVRSRVIAAGCPVRAQLLQGRRERALTELCLRPNRRTLLVAGGSLGAASINEAIAALAGELASLGELWQILHVTGPAKGSPGAEPPPAMTVRTMEYCQRMDLAYAAADLVLCRGGAVTVAELSALGKPAIIMPYPYHADQQQKLNAAELVAAGAAILCDDAKNAVANADMLRRTLLPLLRDEDRLASMARSAAGLGKPDAAAVVAKWLRGA